MVQFLVYILIISLGTFLSNNRIILLRILLIIVNCKWIWNKILFGTCKKMEDVQLVVNISVTNEVIEDNIGQTNIFLTQV